MEHDVVPHEYSLVVDSGKKTDHSGPRARLAKQNRYLENP